MIKINNLPAPMEIAPSKTPLDNKLQRQLKLKQATQAFESIFIAQLLKSMRASSFDPKAGEENGFGKDIMLSMADESVAKQLAKTGMIGVGEVLYNHLLKRLNDGGGESTGLKITSARHIDGVAPPRSAVEAKQVTNQTVHTSSEVGPHAGPSAAPPIRRVVSPEHVLLVPGERKAAQPIEQSPPYDRLKRYATDIRKASEATDVPEELLRAVILQESAGDEKAMSHRGAAGLMQLMPDTARAVGVMNPYNAGENIMGGARYLRQMMDRFGDIESALAAYNAGPGNVIKHGGIPPFAETQAYVKGILSQLSEGKQVNKTPLEADIKK